MKSFDQQVADWARTKAADEAYDYGSNDNCALCQFLRETGMAKNPRVGGDYWREDGDWSNIHQLSNSLQSALHAATFGALADRLSA